MHHLSAEDRPREKLAHHGARALGDNELVALIIGHGRVGRSALAVASDILVAAGGLRGLARLRLEQFTRTPGVGPAQASRLVAAIELGRRTLAAPATERPQFKRGHDAGTYLLPLYGTHPVERFGLLLVDTRYRLIGTRLLSIGSLSSVSAHPRDVFREALLTGAAAVIVFHNHPSGDPAPSPEDISLTSRLSSAGKIVGVPLLDSLVLAEDRFSSLRDMGLMR